MENSILKQAQMKFAEGRAEIESLPDKELFEACPFTAGDYDATDFRTITVLGRLWWFTHDAADSDEEEEEMVDLWFLLPSPPYSRELKMEALRQALYENELYKLLRCVNRDELTVTEKGMLDEKVEYYSKMATALSLGIFPDSSEWNRLDTFNR